MGEVTTTLDQEAAHRFFAAYCFNEAWKLLEKPERSRAEEAQLLAVAHASLYHWSQRPDVCRLNYAISYWQLARAYALCGQGANARYWGQLCQEFSAGEGAFYEAYAWEALARAAKVEGNTDDQERYLAQSRTWAAQVEDAQERATILADLATIG